LGISAIRSAFKARASDEGLPAAKEPIAVTTAFRYGFLSNLLNPKALLFFLGLLPQFIEPGEGAGLRTLMLAGATVVAAALWWAIVVVMAAGAGKKLRRPGVGKRIDVVTGVLLVGLGAFFGVAGEVVSGWAHDTSRADRRPRTVRSHRGRSCAAIARCPVGAG
ncbi:MAG: LysE family translocator, partial [Rhodococcus sp. (in: high G+C Gram-positive bacteria)]